MDIECLKTKRHFADIKSLEWCKKEHDGYINCPFIESNTTIEQTKITVLNKKTKQPSPEILWPITSLTPQKKGIFGKLFGKSKTTSQNPKRTCPRCGSTIYEYQGDKKDWVGVTAKFRCTKCGKQFD